jgi:hypothetical protein
VYHPRCAGADVTANTLDCAAPSVSAMLLSPAMWETSNSFAALHRALSSFVACLSLAPLLVSRMPGFYASSEGDCVIQIAH